MPQPDQVTLRQLVHRVKGEFDACVDLRMVHKLPDAKVVLRHMLAQLSAALWDARGTKATVAFVDLDGTSYRVYFADVRETAAKLPQRDGWQTRAKVKLVEA
mgnify:CR=1 FL=1